MATVCATFFARETTLRPPPLDERPLARLRDDRLLLRFAELLRRPLERLDAFRADDFRLDDFRRADFRRAPPRFEAERDDDPPRFRADFRPRFAPPDLRDDPPLPDFLRDLRLVAAIQFPRMEEVGCGA